MSIRIADRVNRIQESASGAAAQRVRDLRAQGIEVTSLTVGEPDFDTPDHIKDAAIASIRAGDTKYTGVNGTPALQKAILDRYRTRHGLDYPAAQLAVGGGAKQVIFLALMATVEAGDEVIIPAPYWVSYPDMVLANGGTPAIVTASEDDGFLLRPEVLAAAITPRTRWIILNSPSNPSGAVYSAEALSALAEVLRAHPDVLILTDDIYDEITFVDGRVAHLLDVAPDLKDRVLAVNGVSKTYAMTGWRLGYAVGPAPVVGAINKLQSQISSCTVNASQAAAVAALTGDQSPVATMRDEYQRRRDLIVQLINAVPGLSARTPDGAFYLYVNCAALIGRRTPGGVVLEDDGAVSMYLLERARVGVVQGSAYGLSPYFRVSFATSDEQIRKAVTAIAVAVEELQS